MIFILISGNYFPTGISWTTVAIIGVILLLFHPQRHRAGSLGGGKNNREVWFVSQKVNTFGGASA